MAGKGRAGQGRAGHLVSNVLVGYRLDVIIRHYRSAVLTIKIPEKERERKREKEREREWARVCQIEGDARREGERTEVGCNQRGGW